MTWDSLADVRRQTMCDFTKALAEMHHFVRLPSGRWTRTLGPPGLDDRNDGRLALTCVQARVWHLDYVRESALNETGGAS